MVDLVLEMCTVIVGKGVIGRLHGKFTHARQQAVRLIEGTLGGLKKTDRVLRVALRLVETPDLVLQLLADGQSRGIVGGTVDPQPARETLDGARKLSLR